MAAGQALSGFATPLYNKIYIAVRIKKMERLQRISLLSDYNWAIRKSFNTLRNRGGQEVGVP